MAAIGIITLGMITGWSVLAGDTTWPPEPYQEYSVAGAWVSVGSGGNAGMISPPDPKTGVGSGIQVLHFTDPTFSALFPGANNVSPWYDTYVRTGVNQYDLKGVMYVKEDDAMLGILILRGTTTQFAPDMFDCNGTVSFYCAYTDKDGDGQPDPNEVPISVAPTVETFKRI